jgi:hypothetical protein
MSSPDDLESFAIPEAPQQPVAAAEPSVSRETKLAFLAHILTGAPFMQRYEIANVGFVVFATVSPSELDSLRFLSCLGVPHGLRDERLRSLMAVACVNRLEIDHHIIRPVKDRLWDSSFAYDDFVNGIPVGLLQIIESQYLEFSNTLALLISKVTDRSFWPTP